PTVGAAVAAGADVVTFSGDKLLGGPQGGFIGGRKDLLAQVNKNPIKHAPRMDKVRLAAIDATPRPYRDPGRLKARAPTLPALSRSKSDIEACIQRVLPAVSGIFGDLYEIDVVSCSRQVGSGAVPIDTLPSAGIAFRAKSARGSGRALND